MPPPWRLNSMQTVRLQDSKIATFATSMLRPSHLSSILKQLLTGQFRFDEGKRRRSGLAGRFDQPVCMVYAIHAGFAGIFRLESNFDRR